MDQATKDKIIELFNLGSLAPEQQDEMVEKLSGLVFEAALTRALASLEEDEQQDIEDKMSDDMDPEAMLGLLTDKVPNFQDIVAEEMVRLQQHVATTQQAAADATQ